MKWSLCRPYPKARRAQGSAPPKQKSCSWPHSWDRTSEKNPSQIQRTPWMGPWKRAHAGRLKAQWSKLPTFCLSGGHMPVLFCAAPCQNSNFFKEHRASETPPLKSCCSSQLPPASAWRRCFLLLKNESLFLPLTLLFVYGRWSVSSPFPSFIPHMQHGAGV